MFSCSTSFKFSDSDSISEADESDEDELVVKFGSLTESSSSMDIELDGDSGRVDETWISSIGSGKDALGSWFWMKSKKKIILQYWNETKL